MKNILKPLAVAVMAVVMTGLTSCGEKTEVPGEPSVSETTQSALYAFQYNGETVAAGATVYYTPTPQQVSNDQAMVDFYMVNRTDENLETVMKVERVSGPEELDNLEICYDGMCRNFQCPWNSDPMTLVPGVNEDLKMTIDYLPSVIDRKSVYRITIGKGTAMEEPQVMYLDITGE